MELLRTLSTLRGFKFLLQQAIVREIRVRYKQTILGALWALIQPMIFAMLFFAIFGIFRGAMEGPQYFSHLYFLTSLWTFFSNAVSLGTNSIVGHPGLVTKIKFPREVFPLSFVAVSVLDLAISLGLASLLLAWSGCSLSLLELLWIGFAILLLLPLTAFVATLLAGLNVFYRDFKYLTPVFVQLLLFSTPVMYTLHHVAPRAAAILRWNPLTPIFDTVGRCLRHEHPDPLALGGSAIFIIAFGEISCRLFTRMNQRMADVI